MAVSINELSCKFNLEYVGPVKWGDKLNANYNGIYIIALTDDPLTTKSHNYSFEICAKAFNDWKNEAKSLQINSKEVDQIEIVRNHLINFWNPKENILYIGQSTSKTNPIQKRVKQFYDHKIGKKGPHTGGYWLKLINCIKNAHIYYAQANYPRDIEFKMLMKFIELSSGKSFYELDQVGSYLPFANLTADFIKPHSIKYPTNNNKRLK